MYIFDGSIYECEWLDSKMNGKGTLTHSNGTKYIGDILNNNLHG